jgi:hypothetical protein
MIPFLLRRDDADKDQDPHFILNLNQITRVVPHTIPAGDSFILEALHVYLADGDELCLRGNDALRVWQTCLRLYEQVFPQKGAIQLVKGNGLGSF